MHWIIVDKTESIVVESMADGLHIYDNAYGVLTNNPPFDFMQNYMICFWDVTAELVENRFGNVDLPVYCISTAVIFPRRPCSSVPPLPN